MLMNQTPVFVKIDEFKDILSSLNMIKDKLNEANHTMEQIQEMKHKEDEEMDSWRQTLSEVADKVNGLDGVLFDQGQQDG